MPEYGFAGAQQGELSHLADLEHPCLHRNGAYESIYYYSYNVKGKLLKLFSIKRLFRPNIRRES